MQQTKVSFKRAAEKILSQSDAPLSAKEITTIAVAQELISTSGKTPEATMAAQLYVDISKGEKSVFKKIGKGKFALRQQTESVSSPLLMIQHQNSLVRKSLMKLMLEMDPYQFEYLVGDLLKNIGYENVEVTSRSGDKGIDITANLSMDGITDVRTIIQAKRFKPSIKVSNDVIMQLRGSAETGQRGLVITTSDFTQPAIQEAKAANKMPVALVNGEKLLSLMFKYSVGVKKEQVEIYSLNTEYFQAEAVMDSQKLGGNKNRVIWPLPGGIDSYVESLERFLDAIQNGYSTKPKLVQWIMKTFDNCSSEKSANGYINVPKYMGLLSVRDGSISLTAEGAQFLQTSDVEFLYRTIAENIMAFDEIVEFIRSAGKPQTEQSILEYCNENFDVTWTTSAQVNYRLLWLLNVGKIKKTIDGYIPI